MKNLVIEVSEELKQAWPQFRGAAVFATVKNTAYNEELWKRIDEFTVGKAPRCWWALRDKRAAHICPPQGRIS